jgi:hypothetical protein
MSDYQLWSPMTGDVFVNEDNTRIVITRVARDNTWADIRVVQPHGAEWRKRQPLHDGRLPFRVRPVGSATRHE